MVVLIFPSVEVFHLDSSHVCNQESFFTDFEENVKASQEIIEKEFCQDLILDLVR